ncbi:hypothetical protein M0R89_22195 (plasmid) [Halorussus limi]|uniref:Uncharacterized protein n=1 Tax=Halorussus limi TaxID=2938695 RepID=A0A8U0I175_9EURY|nr:hypothetical protein [Halorussus limi]UPV76967.1 hypothetical protein M0R89_22195 [Halorussus limi]
MGFSADGSPWGLLGLAGALSLCCIGTAALAGGAAVAGGTAAGATAVSGPASGLGGILVTALVTALPLVVIGLVLRRRERQ